MRQTHPPALQRPRPEQPDWTNAARWYHGGRRRAGREGGQGVHALGLGVGRPLSRRRRRWQWRRPFSPYVAIKCEARSPTRWLAGWLARSLLFSPFFWNSPSSAESAEGTSRGGGRRREGRSRALTRDGDLFRLQETFRSLVRCSAFIRESDSRSTSFRPPSASAPRRRRGRETTRSVAAPFTLLPRRRRCSFPRWRG